MIDDRRWTANERQVIRDALHTERAHQRRRRRHASSTMVQSDAQWRLVIISEALDAIGSA